MWFITPAAAEAVAEGAAKTGVKGEMLSVGTSLLDSFLGYLVVFIGLSLLMLVIILVGRIMVARSRKVITKVVEPSVELPPVVVPPVKKELAPGSAGDVKLYDTDPRDAAMIMAIVANKLQKPLNELKFVSIKEVK